MATWAYPPISAERLKQEEEVSLVSYEAEGRIGIVTLDEHAGLIATGRQKSSSGC